VLAQWLNSFVILCERRQPAVLATMGDLQPGDYQELEVQPFTIEPSIGGIRERGS
jgi:hypothetical protein